MSDPRQLSTCNPHLNSSAIFASAWQKRKKKKKKEMKLGTRQRAFDLLHSVIHVDFVS